ncbi:MAG: GTP-binding protein [Anaerolineae bacterium]|nr:GTP-binding protein [Anaerolineae bacterium]
MTSIILEGPIAELREREVRLLHKIADAIGSTGADSEVDRQRLHRNAADLRDMFFLVVVIGEFNAGKSSFVNALLGDELLPMGATPTTEAIELVRYATERSRKPTLREDGVLREWAHPNTGAPGVVIVDTPGTGSVFERHERIAKDFLSRSDLVIFLLSAKRAFAQTEKLYLELARSYGKKIILVVNQIDLLDNKEQKDVLAFVRQQSKDLLNLEPPCLRHRPKRLCAGLLGAGWAACLGARATPAPKAASTKCVITCWIPSKMCRQPSKSSTRNSILPKACSKNIR